MLSFVFFVSFVVNSIISEKKGQVACALERLALSDCFIEGLHFLGLACEEVFVGRWCSPALLGAYLLDGVDVLEVGLYGNN